MLWLSLTCYTWHMIYDTSICHAILDTWYMTPVLAMLYLTFDIWHRYLPCYTWNLISDTGTWHVITWPDIVIPDWILLYLTSVLPSILLINFMGTLTWLLYCYQTSGAPVLLNPCTPEWLVSKTAYFIPHLHIYLILNSANNTSLACF